MLETNAAAMQLAVDGTQQRLQEAERRVYDTSVLDDLAKEVKKVVESGGYLDQLRSVDYDIQQEIGHIKEGMNQMSRDQKIKIRDMGQADALIKNAVESAMKDSSMGQKLMEMLSGGLSSHEDSIKNLSTHVQLAQDQLTEAVSQIYLRQHNYNQLNAEVDRIAKSLQEVKDKVVANAAGQSNQPPPNIYVGGPSQDPWAAFHEASKQNAGA